MKEAAARRIVEGLLARLRAGELTVVEQDRHRTWGHGEPSATVEVRSPALWPAVLRGSRGLAESYVDAAWDSPDPADVIRVCARNIEPFDVWRRRLAPVRAPLRRVFGGAGRRNTRNRSREDISAHYDRGNEMFELMLDSTMTYSCGFYETPDATLEQASLAKLDRICRKLELGPDDRVLEIGTGWGSFAAHAAGEYGCHVTTTTISTQQHAHATNLIEQRGLADRVRVLFQDYRDLRGRYDKLVSIEMIEAVGWRDFPTFFKRCSELLADDGAMLLQAIVIDDRAYELEKISRTFIRELIFPNGCLPSVEVIARCVANDTDLRLTDLEDISAHYVPTLRAWRDNLDAHAAELSARGFDERFLRLWRFYLAYCEAGFAERRIRDVQVVLAKPGFRDEPQPSRLLVTSD